MSDDEVNALLAELEATRADLLLALERLHQRGLEHERLLADNIRLRRRQAGRP